jgi:hypothetical protein
MMIGRAIGEPWREWEGLPEPTRRAIRGALAAWAVLAREADEGEAEAVGDAARRLVALATQDEAACLAECRRMVRLASRALAPDYTYQLEACHATGSNRRDRLRDRAEARRDLRDRRFLDPPR